MEGCTLSIQSYLPTGWHSTILCMMLCSPNPIKNILSEPTSWKVFSFLLQPYLRTLYLFLGAVGKIPKSLPKASLRNVRRLVQSTMFSKKGARNWSQRRRNVVTRKSIVLPLSWLEPGLHELLQILQALQEVNVLCRAKDDLSMAHNITGRGHFWPYIAIIGWSGKSPPPELSPQRS